MNRQITVLILTFGVFIISILVYARAEERAKYVSVYAPKDATGLHDNSTTESLSVSNGWIDDEGIKSPAEYNIFIGKNAGIKTLQNGGSHNIYLGPYVDGESGKESYVLRIGSFSRVMNENEVIVHTLTKEEWATMYTAIKSLLPEE